MPDNVNLDGIRTEPEYDLISLYDQSDDVDDPADNDSPFQYANSSCTYYEADDLQRLSSDIKDPLSFFHLKLPGTFGKLGIFPESAVRHSWNLILL